MIANRPRAPMIPGTPIVTEHGRWQVASAPCRSGDGFYSWAKVGEIVGECPISEPGDVWFEFGRTHDEARGKLLAELGLLQ